MSESIYNDIKVIISNTAKDNMAKQNNGYKLAIIGAVLFSDYNKWVETQYNYGSDIFLEKITWEDLFDNTRIIFKSLEYSAQDGKIFYPTKQAKYNELKTELNKNLLFNVDNVIIGERDKINLKTDICRKDINIYNPRVSKFEFDGIAYLCLPYVLDEKDRKYKALDKNSVVLFGLSYFPTAKIEVLQEQDSVSTFTYTNIFKLTEEYDFYENKYDDGKQNKLHLVNNGNSNTVLPNVSTFGGTTKFLMW